MHGAIATEQVKTKRNARRSGMKALWAFNVKRKATEKQIVGQSRRKTEKEMQYNTA